MHFLILVTTDMDPPGALLVTSNVCWELTDVGLVQLATNGLPWSCKIQGAASPSGDHAFAADNGTDVCHSRA